MPTPRATVRSTGGDGDGVGYRYNPAAAHVRYRERDLWCAVIAQAFADIGAISSPTSGLPEPVHAWGKDFNEAVRWLLYDKKDFDHICDLAGVSPHVIRCAAQMFYGRRQLALRTLQQQGG